MTNQNKPLKYYAFFAKYSAMEDYGFSYGLFTRLFRKLLPKVSEHHTIEFALRQSGNNIEEVLNQLDLDTIRSSEICGELDLSIKALSTKIVAFGLDHRIRAHFDALEMDSKPFEAVFDKIHKLKDCKQEWLEDLNTSLNEVRTLILFLRKNKNKIGINLHLTITTRRLLDYIDRIQELIVLKANITSRAHWQTIFENHINHTQQKNSLSRFFRRHTDLLALEIVEHSANKGEKYLAENRSEYWSFFRRSMLGGIIISVFAFIKILGDQLGLSQIQSAFLYSINYAACFILVKQFGGIIATKQPAVTATTLAKGIDVGDNLQVDSIQTITKLVQKVCRSQFISLMGNFMMALLFACLIAFSLDLMGFENLIKDGKPDSLIKNTSPSLSLVAFAGIAGVFLALAGLTSGYIDNTVVASRIAYRIENSKRFFKSKRFAKFVEKKAGALIGNTSLGFLLGCAFLLTYVLPFTIDIRHIAFSSANIGYAVMNGDFTLQIILTAISGALLIGLVNFIVSFSITLYLALKSRGANFRLLPKLTLNIIKDWFKSPLDYYFFRTKK